MISDVYCDLLYSLESLVGVTERETEVGKLGWHRNCTEFDRNFFFLILRNERKKEALAKLSIFSIEKNYFFVVIKLILY